MIQNLKDCILPWVRRGLVSQFLKLFISGLNRIRPTKTINDVPILESPRGLKQKLRILKIDLSQHSPIKFSKTVPNGVKYRICRGAKLLYIRERTFCSRLSCSVKTLA